MAYIKGSERHDSCFLCEPAAPASHEHDADQHVVARGNNAFVILNIYPYNTGHVMVAPYRHVAEIEDLTAAESTEIWAWARRVVEAHKQTTRPHGFNIGINLGQVAGAGVPGHLHLHVVPRWGGDSNFMPVTADTRVLPESLRDTFETLGPALRAVVDGERG